MFGVSDDGRIVGVAPKGNKASEDGLKLQVTSILKSIVPAAKNVAILVHPMVTIQQYMDWLGQPYNDQRLPERPTKPTDTNKQQSQCNG